METGPLSVVRLTGGTLSIEQVVAVARRGAKVEVSPDARQRVRDARAFVDRLAADDRPTYGVNTGFGMLAEVSVARADLERLQLNLVVSHAAGVGEPLPAEAVRALMVCRANVLAGGYSGVREETLDQLVALLNEGVIPLIPSRGSVGASGDLAPLAHLALVLIGRGEAVVAGERMGGAEALRAIDRAPLVLQPKEGLALVNGTQAMLAVGVLALVDAEDAARVADIAGAMTLEGLLGSHRPFRADVQEVRPHPGQEEAAAHVRALVTGSQINASHQEHCDKVQDPYSLRCIPQVHGAVRDGLAFVRHVLSAELNAATDNPLLFTETQEVVSAGNFHGQPLAQALDFLAIAAAQLATISERRVEQLVNPALSHLPPFLAKNSGLHSGFMIAQVTAAALVVENRVLCHPACVDSIPSSAGREDHVSMGMTAALKARTVVDHVRTVLAIELLCAAQALDFRRPLRSGAGVEAAHAEIRRHVSFMDEDRELHADIAAVERLLQSGRLIESVRAGSA
jgi:histidine ammonia-lyase